MTTAREKLFATEVKCDAGEKCLFGGTINHGDDVIIVWINRGQYPVSLADIVNLSGRFEVYHYDCGIKIEGETDEDENRMGEDIMGGIEKDK